MSSNCPTYVKPQALFYYYPWTWLQALPWHLHPLQQVGSGLQGWLGLHYTNWGLTESFLLENTHESQYGTPKIKSLSVNPMGCIVPRVLQDFCYQFVVRAWHKDEESPSTQHGLPSKKTEVFSFSKMKSTKDHLHISSYNQSEELKETTSLTTKKAWYHKHLKDHSTTISNASFLNH